MAELNNTTIFTELATLAPTVAAILNQYPARITASLTSSDAVNGYGHSADYQLSLEMLIHECPACGETQFSRPVFDCANHKFQISWRPIGSMSGSSVTDALRQLDGRAAEWREANIAA